MGCSHYNFEVYFFYEALRQSPAFIIRRLQACWWACLKRIRNFFSANKTKLNCPLIPKFKGLFRFCIWFFAFIWFSKVPWRQWVTIRESAVECRVGPRVAWAVCLCTWVLEHRAFSGARRRNPHTPDNSLTNNSDFWIGLFPNSQKIGSSLNIYLYNNNFVILLPKPYQK